MILDRSYSFFFFFNDTATTEIYTLSLHDALPISVMISLFGMFLMGLRYLHGVALSASIAVAVVMVASVTLLDRKSTRLNSSHANISYAVFCLKKKKTFITLSHESRDISRIHTTHP